MSFYTTHLLRPNNEKKSLIKTCNGIPAPEKEESMSLRAEFLKNDDEQYFPSQWRFTPCDHPFQERRLKRKRCRNHIIRGDIFKLDHAFLDISCSKQEFKTFILWKFLARSIIYSGINDQHTHSWNKLWATLYKILTKRLLWDHQSDAWDHTRGLIKRQFSYKSMIKISSRDLRYILPPEPAPLANSLRSYFSQRRSTSSPPHSSPARSQSLSRPERYKTSMMTKERR